MSLIKQPSDVLYITTVKILLYGQPGLGKTTFGLTSPAPLLLDFDRGIRRVQVQHRKPYVDITTWEDVMNLLNEDLTAYKSLVVDTAGKALDALALTIMSENPKLGYQGSLSQQGYGVLKTRFADFVRKVSALGKNLIFIAHDRENKDGDRTSIRPDIVGGSMASLMREMDLVGYMESLNNKRTLSFNPNDRYYGKNTCLIPNLIEIDEIGGTRIDAAGKKTIITMEDMDMSITKLISMFQVQQNRQNLIAEEYNLLLEVIREKIDNMIDVDTCQLVGTELGTLNHVWGSKAVSQQWFKERLAVLEIGYSKELGYYSKKKPESIPVAKEVAPALEPEQSSTETSNPDTATDDKPKAKRTAKAKVQVESDPA